MKRILVFCALCACGLLAPMQSSAQKFRNSYYDTRRAAYDQEGIPAGAVVFMGDSITEQGWWEMLFKHRSLVNRGIGGDNTFGMLDRLPDILEARPSKIFLMAGINDLTGGQSVDTIVANIARMADMIREAVPECELYIQSVLPVSTKRLAYDYIKGHNPKVAEINARLATLCADKARCTFVDLVPLLSDADGELRSDLTKDGIHLYPAGYVIWSDHIKKLKYLK
ncbi:MAG: GDSL-type esterase/lipase family protein [Alistipes senegalensis]|nr:GDSL-type esterase/lipase family protein [Bacteroides cellulosilyticus]MCM1351868.1 GDSL-type esterase/lipase family protein [Alistipes senegalensis]